MSSPVIEIDPDDLYEYRTKKYARMQVFDSVQDGQLERPYTCEMCTGYHEEMQAHHTDYGDPLNVVWVCPSCHAGIHANKDHPLNPINHDQSVNRVVKKGVTYASVTFRLPIENYLIIKNRSDRLGLRVQEQIERSLIRMYPLRMEGRNNDDTCEQFFERISSLVEDEAKLPTQKLSWVPEPRGEGNNFRSTMERFYSLSSRYG